MVGVVIREFLPWPHLLTYLDAILRVYNRFGRRDNIHKARIKILVKERGADSFREEVEAEWAHLKDGPDTLIPQEIARVESRFTRPAYENLGSDPDFSRLGSDPGFAAWTKRNVHPHEQNLVFADVRSRDLAELWREARALGLATPNIGLLTNIISCPGGDFCALANAKSIPVAQAIQERFDDLDYLHEIGELDLNISGCMNACGHHHVGHIGILGVDKNGEEWYQVEIGGNQSPTAIGKVIGPSFARADVPGVVEKLIGLYLERRDSEAERFVDVVRRIGIEPFKERVYGHAHQRAPRSQREPALA
jgi:sulfite reductase (NADPH) hemoprotein beta-component